jgi:tRNA(fMet)-specific endonuclease VapC
MLDTNVCVRVLRDKPISARRRFEAEQRELCISTIVLSELLFGAARSMRPDAGREAVSSLVSRLELLPFDHAAAAHAGDIRAELRREGRTIGPFDALIAGHARSRGLVMVTGNLGEFGRVPGLRCEDWLDG